MVEQLHWSATMMKLCTAIGLCLLACWGSPVLAQDFPTRPVTIVMPYDPGGLPDIVGRTIAAKMQEALGQPVVVRNRPGAASMIGTTEVARSAPDGYTLLINGPALAVLPTLFKTVTYNAERDLTPITRLVELSVCDVRVAVARRFQLFGIPQEVQKRCIAKLRDPRPGYWPAFGGRGLQGAVRPNYSTRAL